MWGWSAGGGWKELGGGWWDALAAAPSLVPGTKPGRGSSRSGGQHPESFPYFRRKSLQTKRGGPALPQTRSHHILRAGTETCRAAEPANSLPKRLVCGETPHSCLHRAAAGVHSPVPARPRRAGCLQELFLLADHTTLSWASGGNGCWGTAGGWHCKNPPQRTRGAFLSVGRGRRKNDPAMWHLSCVWGAELRHIHALQPRKMLARGESFLTPKTPMICSQECLKGLTRSVAPFNGAGEWQS